MFNWFKKKVTNTELFRNGNVEYIVSKRGNKLKQLKAIRVKADYYGFKISLKTGLFVYQNGDDLFVEPVIRAEKVGNKRSYKKEKQPQPTGRPRGRPKGSSKVGRQIRKLLKDGQDVKIIAKTLNTSTSYVYRVKKNMKK